MLQTSARLIRLLTLLQARATWTGDELAARLDVTTRTVRRDADRLRSLGYPVESTAGVAGGYALGAGASLPPLHLDEDEATAVFVGLHTAAGGEVTGADTASIHALAKLERVLPPRIRRKLATLRSAVLRLADRAAPVSLADVATLAGACSERLVARFSYATDDGRTTQRQVEPLQLVRVGTRWYLVAWDTAKDAWRTFRVDRIRALATTGARFRARPPPDDDVTRYVTASLSAAPYRYHARVLIHSAPGPLRERVTAYEGVLEPHGRNQCVLRTGGHSLDGLAVMVAMLGVDFEVLEPPELAAHVRAMAARLTRAARRPARKMKA